MLPTLRVRALRRIMKLPSVLRRRLGTGPTEVDGARLDDATRMFLRVLTFDRLPTHRYPLDEQREAFRQLAIQCSGEILDAVVSEHSVGACRLRIYRPPTTTRTALLWLHGGGWVIGDLDTHDAFCRRVAVGANVVVASLGYRLAPEHPFPAAIEDVLHTMDWLRTQAEALSLDADRIAVGGDSAGGNLSAVLCQQLAQLGEAQPWAQVLLYPGVDATRSHPSHARFGEGFFLTRGQVDYFLDAYMGQHDPTDPRISPLFAEDLTGLAPALVHTAGLDPLLDEGRAYATRLEEAGVPVTRTHTPAMVHGYISLAGIIPAADRAVSSFVGDIAAVLHRDNSSR